MLRHLALLLLVSPALFPQTAPRFEDFPAPKSFKGKPAAPKVDHPSDRMYRTRIREAAAKGPNFAGHFTIAQWGCGSSCVQTVIVNAATGAVFHLPASELPCEENNQPTCPISVVCQSSPWEFRPDSELLIVRACSPDNKPLTIYLRWTGAKFERLR